MNRLDEFQRTWQRAGALVSIALALAFAGASAAAMSAGSGPSTAVGPSDGQPGPIIRSATIAGVPGLISIPEHITASTALVVMYHGFGPPASPEALAKAIPPVTAAVSFYPWLPLFGPRMGPGGTRDLVQRQSDDYIGRLLFPVMQQAAAELPKVVGEISGSFHLSGRRPLIIFGFSAGGAAVLLSLTQSELRPAGIVVLNAPLSVSQAVEGYEKQLGHPYSWTKAARQAAVRYDVVAHASTIGRRHAGAAFLLLQSDHDAGYGVGPALAVAEALKTAVSKYAADQDIRAVVVPNADHYVLDASRSRNIEAQAAESVARSWISDWMLSHASHAGEESHHG